MTASIRGHQGLFKVYENGAETKIIDITSVDISQDSDFSRTEYVGRAVPEGDQSVKGWSGSIDLEVKDSSVDEFIDGLVTNNLNGIGVSEYTFIETELYPNGTSKAYVHFDCQFKMSKSIRGLSEKVTKKLDFQSSGRLAI